MSLLVFFILLSIGVSFLCSLLEAVILSVTPSYLSSLQNSNPQLHKKVKHLKSNIEKPLASILTFNTVAHTVGAAGAGAQAQLVFGSESFAIFSAILTFAILFFSEIIPKSIGASSWRSLLAFASIILKPMMVISYPLVWLSEKVSQLFKGKPTRISRDEIAAMADIGLSHGTIQESEHQALKGVIEFTRVKATEVMVPAQDVMSIDNNLSLEEAYHAIQKYPYSRIIVTDTKTKAIRGYILRTKLQEAHIKQWKGKISSLVLPINTFSVHSSLPKMFQVLLKEREHICAITGSKGTFVGIITLEDLIEHMLNLEIYDEQDHQIEELKT